MLCICFLMIAQAGAQSLDFDPDLETGFLLTGAHQTVSCESCHTSGIFKGAPGQYSRCHDGSIAIISLKFFIINSKYSGSFNPSVSICLQSSEI